MNNGHCEMCMNEPGYGCTCTPNDAKIKVNGKEMRLNDGTERYVLKLSRMGDPVTVEFPDGHVRQYLNGHCFSIQYLGGREIS